MAKPSGGAFSEFMPRSLRISSNRPGQGHRTLRQRIGRAPAFRSASIPSEVSLADDVSVDEASPKTGRLGFDLSQGLRAAVPSVKVFLGKRVAYQKTYPRCPRAVGLPLSAITTRSSLSILYFNGWPDWRNFSVTRATAMIPPLLVLDFIPISARKLACEQF